MHLISKSFVADEAWVNTIGDIAMYGESVEPQKSTGSGGRVSFEILNHTLAFNMAYPIVTKKPNTSWSYMIAEAMWVISGSSKLNWHPIINKIQGPYSDDGIKLNGAYGPPFRRQLEYVVETLKRDINSRQAFMTIWARNPKPSKDIPCTTSVQFIVRKNKLDCLVTMRSSDVGMGLPYDMLTFTCMAAEVASRLEGIELGACCVTAGSRHIYIEHFDKLKSIYYEHSGFAIVPQYAQWQTWKWDAIKEKFTRFLDLPYDDNDRLAYNQAAGFALMNAAGTV